MKWTQIKVTCGSEKINQVAAILTAIDPGVMIEDYSDVLTTYRTVYGELIDEKILNADKSVASASIYAKTKEEAEADMAFINERLDEAGIKAEIEFAELDEEDWSTAWRKFYKPTRIGNRMVIVPSWEKYDAKPGDIIIDMDPGLAFGTGTHETTRLCATLLEKYVNHGDYMLDVGSGSGILAICAAKLGAGYCAACDIDPVAVETEKENALRNGCKIDCFVSDLLDSVQTKDGREYDIVTANIVADIIIRMSHDIGRFIRRGGKLIVSGIIVERESEVRLSLEENGFELVETAYDNGWCALTYTKK